MKFIPILFIGCFTLITCSKQKGRSTSSSDKYPEHHKAAQDSNGVASAETAGEDQSPDQPFLLTETSIASLTLPFPKRDMLDELSAAFGDYRVTKDVGQQDGPDFPVYNVRDGQDVVLFFAMNWQDTFKLDAVYVGSPAVVDEYGLAVGRGLDDIQRRRKGSLRTQRDYHGHTYAIIDDSNIIYEIAGNENLPDTADIEKANSPGDQPGKWTITKLIWRSPENRTEVD